MSRISVVDEAQERVARAILPGDFVIDATVGNGGDTEFLCRRAGPDGLVLGIDIQASAIESTTSRLQKAGLLDRSILVIADHSLLSEIANERVPGRSAGAIMFNLGYLPRGDNSVTTVASGTVEALTEALSLLRIGGLLSIVVYRGHPGGQREAEAVEHWLHGLSRDAVHVSTKGRDQALAHRPYVAFVARTG